MKDDFAKQSTAFHATNEAQRLHFQTGQGELSRQIDELNATIQKLEHQQDELREATKQEFLQAVADSNASRLTWEEAIAEEMTARRASEAAMRKQLLDDVNATAEAAIIQMREESEALTKQNEARFKQNRWILIGLGVLGAAQIVLQLI
jgi:septal ring factor EnvC (AmiA/AmiB activator)